MVEGSELGGYRIIRQIGEGGMGTVWLAEHVKLGRQAALKVLHPSFSQQSDVVARFFNEARAATAIPDPGIVQVFDFGHSTDGIPYIVMELLEGEALDRRLHRLGGLPISDSLRIVRQVASTLGLAHQRGIVHRDIKPENIFLVRDPEVAGGERAKLLDFGIAKLLGEQSSQTQTKTVIGTPLYMSPEQCRGTGHVDQRSDIYSMGCVLFRLVTGTPPYMAEGTGELIAMHLREPPVAPSRRKPGIPAEIDQIVLRCMAKDPAERFASGAQLAAALGLLVGGTSMPQFTSIAESPTVIAKAPSPTTIGMATGASARSERVPRRNTSLIVGSGLIAAAALATIIVARSGGSDVAAVPAPAEPVAADQPHDDSSPSPAHAQGYAPPIQPPQPADPSTAIDPHVALEARMKRLFAKFTLWARDHAGAPCPELSAIDPNATDPWGHPLVLTCTQQPETQVVGAISLGPDGVVNTSDDIASWKLTADISIPGHRWATPIRPAETAVVRSKPPKPARARTRSEAHPATEQPRPPAVRPTSASAPSGTDLDNDGIPDVR
ncbi:MAG: protein kinase [Kofleriaceae bacterium]